MTDKIVHVNGIGEVIFKKNHRSKNVSIALRPLKGIVVTMPKYISYKQALSIVEKKRSWILEHQPKIEQVENKATIFTKDTSFNTKFRKLSIHENYTNKVVTKISSNTIDITYPANYPVKHPVIQKLIKSSLTQALRLEAKEYLPNRTLELAQKHRFRFNKVYIKNAKTLWGSCSGKNNINLNLHLMRLPDHLIDYVIIHELCHTHEKNHGKPFWTLMDSILGDAKKIAKELRTYSIQIY